MGSLDRFEAAISAAIARGQADGAPQKLADALHYAVMPGGARVRPSICLAVAKACGMDQPHLAMTAAVALEMVHCASLVHDDMPCFDDADIRRGKPSVHKAYGEEIALLTGDSLIILAFEALAQPGLGDADRAMTLIRQLARYSGTPFGICSGQGWESEPVIQLSAYHRAKTGALFVAASEMGAVAAGQPAEEWTELGARIGEAYQVADDLRDALLTERELGKPAGQDERHARPSVVTELGVDGSIQRLKDILSGAISSIPQCPGEAELAQIVQAQSARLMPMVSRTPAE